MIFMTLLVILVGDIGYLSCFYGQKRGFLSVCFSFLIVKMVKHAYFYIKIGECFKDSVSNSQDSLLINDYVCFRFQ